MANTDLQSILIPITVSPDGGTTKYSLVCLVDNSFESQFPVNNEQSQCGIHTGIGAHAFSFKFNAVVNATPDAVLNGVGQASYKQLLTWHQNQNKLLVEQQSGTNGVDFYIGGTYYLNQVSHAIKVGDVVKFSGTLTGTGVPDFTP